MFQLPKSRLRRIALLALSVFFVVAGVNHFVDPDFYTRIMPPYLPAHLELVYASGVFEILGGIAVLVPGVRVLAGYGLILLLVAVYPANIQMAIDATPPQSGEDWAAWVRLPLQIPLFAWAISHTR